MKIHYEELKKQLLKDYKVKGSVSSILNGNRQPNAELRYKYEKELGIPFNGWGENIRKYIEEACPCCGTILRDKKAK